MSVKQLFSHFLWYSNTCEWGLLNPLKKKEDWTTWLKSLKQKQVTLS